MGIREIKNIRNILEKRGYYLLASNEDSKGTSKEPSRTNFFREAVNVWAHTTNRIGVVAKVDDPRNEGIVLAGKASSDRIKKVGIVLVYEGIPGIVVEEVIYNLSIHPKRDPVWVLVPSVSEPLLVIWRTIDVKIWIGT